MSKEPKSAIWHSNYFKRNIDGDTLCILCEQNRCKMCKSAKNSCVLTGSHASNAKKHLKTLHPKEHEKFVVIETTNQIASTSTPERQQKRKFAEGPPFSDFFKARPCPSNVVTEQEQNLARLVARPTTPISIVESDEFIKFVENYDSRFKIPRSSLGAFTGIRLIAEQIFRATSVKHYSKWIYNCSVFSFVFFVCGWF